MAGFTFNFCVEEEEHVNNGATCFIEKKGAYAEPLDKGDISVTLSQTKEVKGDGGDTADLEAKELVILPFHKELVDHVTPHTFDIPSGSLEILYVDSAGVERVVETTKTQHGGPNTNPDSDTKTGMKNSNIFNQPSEPETGLVKLLELSNSSHSDLIPGVYEGGLKVWECAFDLVEYLANSDIHFSGKRVLELGCGAGLPALLTLMKGAEEVHFQDYNPQVIDHVTIPSVLLNVKSLANHSTVSSCHGCKFYSGDWSSLIQLLPAKYYDIILTSETIYSPASQPKLLTALKHLLRRKEGVVYVAAKSYYFGVGGSVSSFIELVKQYGYFNVERCSVISCEVPREILKLNPKP